MTVEDEARSTLPGRAASHRARGLALCDMREEVALRRPVGTPQALAATETVFVIDMLGRDFGDEAAGDAAHPLAVDTPVRSMIDARALAGASDRNIGEAAFLLEAGNAAFVHRSLRRKDAVFPASEENIGRIRGLWRRGSS